MDAYVDNKEGSNPVSDRPSLQQHGLTCSHCPPPQPHPVCPSALMQLQKETDYIQSLWQSSSCRFCFHLSCPLSLIKRCALTARWSTQRFCPYFFHMPAPLFASFLRLLLFPPSLLMVLCDLQYSFANPNPNDFQSSNCFPKSSPTLLIPYPFPSSRSKMEWFVT